MNRLIDRNTGDPAHQIFVPGIINPAIPAIPVSYYRYTYECCSIPVSCSSKSITSDASNVVGESAVFLDRQNVTCGQSYLSSFQLKTYRTSNIQYEYKCCSKNNVVAKCYENTTEFTDDGDGNTIFLDRQKVECQFDYGLASFQLERHNDHNQWRYNFKCCKFEKP